MRSTFGDARAADVAPRTIVTRAPRGVAHVEESFRGRILELDGFRGLAALGVVIAHYFGEVEHGIRAFMHGSTAVGMFFVLSGYLIGGIILRGREQPGFIGRFYLKRAARIIPIYLIVVLGTFGLAVLLAGRPWVCEPLPLWTYLTFTQNYVVPTSGPGSPWLLPTWTLAVEEQFYLLLPALVLVVPRRRLLATLLGLCAAAIVFRLAVFDTNSLWALTPLPGRADLLLAGVCAALLEERFNVGGWVQPLRWLSLLGAVLLLISAAVSYKLFVVLGPTALAFASACFILAIAHGAPEGARQRSPLLCSIGQISYCLYLVHQPINGLLHGVILGSQPDIATPAQLCVTLAALALSLLLSRASWELIEAPLLRLAHSTGDKNCQCVLSRR